MQTLHLSENISPLIHPRQIKLLTIQRSFILLFLLQINLTVNFSLLQEQPLNNAECHKRSAT
jgi:hypothetical protein